MSGFTAHLGLQAVETEQGIPVTKNGRQLWEVIGDLAYEVGAEGSGVTVCVPGGTRTDLASIPRLFWSILPPDGPWLKAAVIHDYLYAMQGRVIRTGHLAPFTRKEADEILREAMGVLGVVKWKREVIFLAVRVGGSSGWGS